MESATVSERHVSVSHQHQTVEQDSITVKKISLSIITDRESIRIHYNKLASIKKVMIGLEW